MKGAFLFILLLFIVIHPVGAKCTVCARQVCDAPFITIHVNFLSRNGGNSRSSAPLRGKSALCAGFSAPKTHTAVPSAVFPPFSLIFSDFGRPKTAFPLLEIQQVCTFRILGIFRPKTQNRLTFGRGCSRGLNPHGFGVFPLLRSSYQQSCPQLLGLCG